MACSILEIHVYRVTSVTLSITGIGGSVGCASNELSPVVQSVVSLTSSLRVILLTVLADSIYNILIFFC